MKKTDVQKISFCKLRRNLSGGLVFLLLVSCSPLGSHGDRFVAGLAEAFSPQSSTAGVDPVEVFFTPNPQGHTDFIKLVQGAQKSINLVMFRITDMDDAQALVAAVQRQVRVRVIVDSAMLGSFNPTVQKTLEAGGVELKPSSKAFSITHEKAMTLDGIKAMISTINLTKAYRNTRGIGVISKDPSVINEFDQVFEADWKNADQNTKNTPAVTSEKLLWSPVNATDKLIALIQSARSEIEVYVENFVDADIAKALILVASRGVKVRVLTPLCDENPNPILNLPMMKNLMANGVQARMMKHPSTVDQPYIHAKSIVVDGQRTYVGSMNFSYNSLKYAREVGIIFSNAQASSLILQKFEGDWTQAELPPDSGEGLCPGEKSNEISK